MAHFQYPMRQATPPEKAAFAYPDERGIMKPHLDKIGIDIGSRIVSKGPFLVGEYMIPQGDEFVVTEKGKSDDSFVIKSIRENNISFDATGEELDARFYVVSGPERTVHYSPAVPLLGGDDIKPAKMEEEDDDEDDDDKDGEDLSEGRRRKKKGRRKAKRS